MTEGAGGLAAVSPGLSALLIILILAVVAFGGWKLVKLVWALFD
jgi:hypothetical protein